jgi:cell division protein ZapA
VNAERDQARVSVRILEKEYFIACPYEERSALLDSAEFLNARMREVRDSGKVVGLDRIAVMVALNLTNELLQLKGRDVKAESEAGTRVKNMRERVEAALSKSGTRQSGKGRQLEL